MNTLFALALSSALFVQAPKPVCVATHKARVCALLLKKESKLRYVQVYMVARSEPEPFVDYAVFHCDHRAVKFMTIEQPIKVEGEPFSSVFWQICQKNI